MSEPTQPSAKIIADSISKYGDRLTTFEIEFHRFELPSFNTHRLFSRNSASSRAIPFTKHLERFTDDPAFPIAWTSEQPGMQGGSELTDWDLEKAQELFIDYRNDVSERIQAYLDDVSWHYNIGFDDPDPERVRELKSHTLHKSLINRLLEPLLWHKVIVTATDYDGFYEQRVSELAQPEIAVVASAMQALMSSEPKELEDGEWHLPYVTDEEVSWLGWEGAKKISAARCARVSYLTHSGESSLVKDFQLYDKLVSAQPQHHSPKEHQATPDPKNVVLVNKKGDPNWVQYRTSVIGNFTGWMQFRHEGETWSYSV